MYKVKSDTLEVFQNEKKTRELPLAGLSHYQVSKCSIALQHISFLTTVWLNKLNWDIKRLVLGIESGLIEFIDLRPDL